MAYAKKESLSKEQIFKLIILRAKLDSLDFEISRPNGRIYRLNLDTDLKRSYKAEEVVQLLENKDYQREAEYGHITDSDQSLETAINELLPSLDHFSYEGQGQNHPFTVKHLRAYILKTQPHILQSADASTPAKTSVLSRIASCFAAYCCSGKTTGQTPSSSEPLIFRK